MRNEIHMMNLILDTANNDARIRAVIMNGSRTNPNVQKDCFQDYDIVYVVNDIDTFTSDHSWIDIFGERIMVQMPEAQELMQPQNNGTFNYLILLRDGNRIDLTLIPIEKKDELIETDSLTIALLDKDDILPKFPPSSDIDYHVQPPNTIKYFDCCNEFWWILQNVAKGIWRDELPYAMKMYGYNREMLDQMICWWIGIKYDFKISPGKMGKYFKNHLNSEQWQMYCSTYSDSNYENLWKSISTSCELFRPTALEVAKHFNFDYNYDDDMLMTEYLMRVKELPIDAKEIY